MSFTKFVLPILLLSSIAFAADPANQTKQRKMRTMTSAEAATRAAGGATQKANKEPATTQEFLEPDYPTAWEAAEKAIDNFKVPSGLKVSVFAAEPQLANPVAMSIDDKGRFWVVETFRFDGGGPGGWGVYDIRHMYERLDDDLSSKTVEQRLATLNKWNNNDLHSLAEWPDRLRLIQDTDGDGKADSSSVFCQWQDPLDGLASGVITRGDDVYVTNIPDLWLLRDTDHDGVADFKKSLSHGYGVRYSLLGHDMHGLRWGPDGRLYFSMGDRGLHVTTQEGKVIDLPDEGSVLRCDPDGSNLEVFATGLRNPQKLTFDQYGNLFTGDNNCDYGDPARWVYVCEGGDSGWRIGYQHLRTPKSTGPWLAENLTALPDENTAAYLIPPVGHIASGPSGCTYYPGVGFPEKFNEHFFLTDFRAGPSSLTHSFALKPKGAGFEIVDRGSLIEHVVATDVEFGPDCAAYVCDWNSSWNKSDKGRIYRIAAPDLEKSPLVLETKKLLNEGMSQRKPAELATLLGHADMRVRLAAQFELAQRGNDSVSLLADVAGKSDKRLARIHAIWALGQIGRKSPEALKSVVGLLGDKDDEIRAQAAKVLGDDTIQESLAPMIRLTADPSPRVRYFAAMGLSKLARPEAVGPIVKLLADNADKDHFLRHAGVVALAKCADSDALLNAARSETPAVRMGAALAWRRLRRGDVAMLLKDPRPEIVLEAARAINDVPIESAQPELAKLLGSVTMAEPVILRALNANFRLGGQENANAVAAFAARGDAPESMRIEALAMLQEWEKPRGIDRVVGVWRPLTQPMRDAAIAKNATKTLLASIVTSNASDAVRIAGIDLIRKVGPDDPSVLTDLVMNKSTPPDIAAAALSAMEGLKDPRLSEAAESALSNGKGVLRSSAIRMLVGRDDAAKRLEQLLASGSIPDQQAVFVTLGDMADKPAAEAILATQVDKYIAGQIAPEVQLDLLEAAGKSNSQAMKSKLKTLDDKRPKNDPLAAYAESLMGGDAGAGKHIFFDRQDVSCLRCHKIDGQGGVVGPELTGVASRHERKYLLESIVNPNAQIAPGFESTIAHMKAGKNYSGVIKADTSDELVIDSGDGATIHLAKKEIESRTKGLSPMPQDISKTLSKRDVRDLVEFLSTLKAPATQPTQTVTAAPAKQ